MNVDTFTKRLIMERLDLTAEKKELKALRTLTLILGDHQPCFGAFIFR